MELWNYDLATNAQGHLLRHPFRQCEGTIVYRTRVGYGVIRERCGGDAMRGMTWQGLTEGIHSALLCDSCTERYLGPMIPAQPPAPQEAR